jgi:hypothetical protein
LYGLALGALALVLVVGFAPGAETVAATQGEAVVELRPLAMYGWTWSGWDAALIDPKTPEAQYNRGVMHASGHGQPHDDDEALKWFRLAAEGGHVLEQCNLGVMYASGRGVLQDVVQAWAWFEIAAGQGDNSARENREIVAVSMTVDELGWARKAVLELAIRHRLGRGSSAFRSSE